MSTFLLSTRTYFYKSYKSQVITKRLFLESVKLGILVDYISQAKNSVKLFVRFDVFSLIIDDFFSCLSKFVALDFYLSEEIYDQIEKNPFLLNKIYRLREAGASFYKISSFERDLDIVCQIDFKKILVLRNVYNQSRSTFLIEGESTFAIYKERYDQTDLEISEYRLESDDIRISFYSDSSNVIRNSSTKFHWKVSNASRVEIDGIGDVPATGTQTVTLLSDTIINIRAFNQKHKKIKSLLIRAINRLVISYDIQYLNPASNEFCSLKEADSNGVYGIYKGNKIKLVWNVEYADEVAISPFGYTDKLGEHIFSISDVLEIMIHAKMRHGKTKITRIIIHEFPVHIFRHKFARIDDKYLPNVEFNVKDMRMQAYSFLKEKGYLRFAEVSARLRKQALSSERELLSMYNKRDFRSFYNTYSISKLNKNIKERLLSYFQNMPSIHSTVNRMPNHHD